jgi:hypothetical protein
VYQQQQEQQQEQQDAENPFLDPPFSPIKIDRSCFHFFRWALFNAPVDVHALIFIPYHPNCHA